MAVWIEYIFFVDIGVVEDVGPQNNQDSLQLCFFLNN